VSITLKVNDTLNKINKSGTANFLDCVGGTGELRVDEKGLGVCMSKLYHYTLRNPTDKNLRKLEGELEYKLYRLIGYKCII
jgi:hypothetical protein